MWKQDTPTVRRLDVNHQVHASCSPPSSNLAQWIIKEIFLWPSEILMSIEGWFVLSSLVFSYLIPSVLSSLPPWFFSPSFFLFLSFFPKTNYSISRMRSYHKENLIYAIKMSGDWNSQWQPSFQTSRVHTGKQSRETWARDWWWQEAGQAASSKAAFLLTWHWFSIPIDMILTVL